MKSLQSQTITELTNQEIKSIFGGNNDNNVMDDGSGQGCTTDVIIIKL